MRRKRAHRSQELELLLELIGQSFNRKSWHGTNLRGSIRGVTAHQAAWRPSPGRHNIWELVVHCAYWKYIVRRRLLGEKRGSFPLKGSNWFQRPEILSEDQWRKDVQLLEGCHDSLCEAVAMLKSSDLQLTPRGSTVSNAAIITGIASHDIYHAGQIQTLKRLMK